MIRVGFVVVRGFEKKEAMFSTTRTSVDSLLRSSATPAPVQHVVDVEVLRHHLRQEIADRLAVERYFLIREEHHCRQRNLLQQEHAVAQLRAQFTFGIQIATLKQHHQLEVQKAKYSLDATAKLASLRTELATAASRTEDTRQALLQAQEAAKLRRAEAEASEAQEHSQWTATKTTLIQEMSRLKNQVTSSHIQPAAAPNVPAAPTGDSLVQRVVPNLALLAVQVPEGRQANDTADIAAVTARTADLIARANAVLSRKL